MTQMLMVKGAAKRPFEVGVVLVVVNTAWADFVSVKAKEISKCESRTGEVWENEFDSLEFHFASFEQESYCDT